MQHRDHAGGGLVAVALVRGDVGERDLVGAIPDRRFHGMLDDAAAGRAAALTHLADHRDDLLVLQDLFDGRAAGLLKIETQRAGGGFVGEDQLIERVRDKHRVGDAVDDRLGVLTLGGGDFELDLQLFRLERGVGDFALGLLEQIVHRVGDLEHVAAGRADAMHIAAGGALVELRDQAGDVAADADGAEHAGGGAEQEQDRADDGQADRLAERGDHA